jgi:general stress protein 26
MQVISAEAVVARARGILDAAYYSFLVTTDENGESTGRLVQHFDPEHALTLWIGTAATSRKVAHLTARPRALVTCQSTSSPAYVALSGTVSIHLDPAVRRRYWNEAWRRFWPEGPLSDRYVVLEFRCERIELIDFSSNAIAPDPFGMTPAVVERSAEEWLLRYPRPA